MARPGDGIQVVFAADGKCMTAILGISAFYHDSAAALVVDGEIAAAAQEERFTRIKHDAGFPGRAVDWCLEQAGIGPGDLDFVVFYDKPLLKFDRLLETYLTYAPRGFPSFARAMPEWLGRKLHMNRILAGAVGRGYVKRFMYLEHHQSHAASAFFPSPFDEAAILTVDGVGEWATATWGAGRGNRIELEAALNFPHSLGLLYSAFTYYCGFKVNSGEYKLMGLAPYGEPAYADLVIKRLIDLEEDGSFSLDMAYFDYCKGVTMTSRAFNDLFGGPPREPDGPIEKRHMDIAASIQRVAEEVVLRMARHVHRRTGLEKLCMAGGVALNCVANGRLLREGPFDEIWIQPAAGDAGGALGAALFAWHQVLDEPRKADGRDAMKGALLGPRFTEEEIRGFLESRGAAYRFVEDEGELLRSTASLLAGGKVVGWFQGRMEFGPRALGSRSILGDPRVKDMQSRINRKIKFRESFRPFAPSVLRRRVSDYFDLPRGFDSPYMLFVAPVSENVRRKPDPSEAGLDGLDKLGVVRSSIPAVTHVDYTARVQTVDPARHGRFHGLLEAFEDATGCGVLVNTSFNVRGEPIVCSPEDAWECFTRTGMDALVMERFVVQKGAPGSMDTGDVPGAGGKSGAGVDKREADRFALFFPLVLGAAGCIAAVLTGRWTSGILPWIAAVVLGTAGVFLPASRPRVYRAWTAATRPIGTAVSMLALGIVYFLVVFPTGILYRKLGRRGLRTKPVPGSKTYWQAIEQPDDLERLFRRY